MTDATERARLETALAEVQAALLAITTENATHVEFDGRSISRPSLDVLESEEERLKVLLNGMTAAELGGDYIFGRYVEYT